MSSPPKPISTASVEQTLLGEIKDTDISYLVVNLVNGVQPIAVFSFYLDAFKYMVRVIVNDCQDLYTEMVDDEYPDYKSTEQSYTNYVRDHIKEFMRIIPVHHLVLSKSVYVCRSSNYMSRGQCTDYVTNSEEEWKHQMKFVYSRVKCDISNFRLKVNPSLPELNSFPIEDECNSD